MLENYLTLLSKRPPKNINILQITKCSIFKTGSKTAKQI